VTATPPDDPEALDPDDDFEQEIEHLLPKDIDTPEQHQLERRMRNRMIITALLILAGCGLWMAYSAGWL